MIVWLVQTYFLCGSGSARKGCAKSTVLIQTPQITRNQIGAFIGNRHPCAGAIDKCTDREPLFASATRTILRGIKLFFIINFLIYTIDKAWTNTSQQI